MLQRGRIPDPQFDGHESLYRRFKSVTYTEDVPPTEDISALLRVSFNFNPHPSVNRGRYSSKNDVLFAESTYDWGVYAFRADAIPQQCVGGDQKTYEFALAHVPELKNYAHSEIQTSIQGIVLTKSPPRSIRDYVRTSLEPAVTIVRRPSLGEWLACLKRRIGL